MREITRRNKHRTLHDAESVFSSVLTKCSCSRDEFKGKGPYFLLKTVSVISNRKMVVPDKLVADAFVPREQDAQNVQRPNAEGLYQVSTAL